jgi:rifampicin phosphotransferase
MLERFLIVLGLLFSSACAYAVPGWRSAIETEAQFTELSRTVSARSLQKLPQVLFVIDRAKTGAPRIFFVNSRKYQFHIEFVQQTYLTTQTLEQFNKATYTAPDRRFVVGSVVRYPKLNKYGVEFTESDILTPAILSTTMSSLQAVFPKPLAFKPNAQLHYTVAASVPGLKIIDSNAVYGSRDVLVLNAGRAVGRLRMLKRVTPETLLGRGDIVILEESPLQMSPVAGIITTEFSTPLAHVNLLAKSWRIPNGFLRRASATYQDLDGKMVVMIAKGDAITLRLAKPAEIAAALRTRQIDKVQIARADVTFRDFPALTEQSRRDVTRTGAKAANLGDVASRVAKRRDSDFVVPQGFSVPFAYYADFIRANALDVRIEDLLKNKEVLADGPARKKALADLRAAFLAAPMDAKVIAAISRRRAQLLGDAGVFARSSTNSEDLKGFNGAGLYTSVPNVITEDALAMAIKTVWSSVWNDVAFDARVAAGVDHRSVMASVLIQRGMNADAAGVMITENPFDANDSGAIFINAKKGLGIRVVEGRKVAEQLLYRPDFQSIQVLTRSTDDVMLSFDKDGGVREVAVEPGRSVLTDKLAKRLAQVGQTIHRYFDYAPQDIEWVTIGDKIFIVQSRPYLRGN